MNRNHVIAITGLAFILGAGSALADDLEATITVIAEADVATPDVIMHGIELPAAALTNADDSANVNADLVNDALARRQAALDDAAAEVEAHFADAVDAAAEASSRAEDLPDAVPDGLPGQPGG